VKRTLFLLFFLAASAVWCPASFAQRQAAVGTGTIPLDATGILNGVDMSASGTTGTLSVGVVGGPQTDIFTSNNPPVAGLVAVSTSAASQGNIVFNSSSTVFGAIGVTQPGGPFLLNISGGNAGTAVNFLGPVFATTLDVTGTGAVNFNSGSTNVTATNFAADGTISLAPNTTVIGALTTTAGANTGTLALGGGSVLDGAVGGAIGIKAINVVGGSNVAGVTASITGAANAFSFSLGTNTLNVGGSLTIANGGPSGVINTTLASPTLYGNIRPVGATNLGPTLRVNVTVPSTAFIPVGSLFNIVQTQTGTVQSGTDGSVVAVTVQNPTNPLYTFSAYPPAGTIAGQVTIRTTGIPLLVPLQPPPGVPLPPSQPIAAVVVPALLALPPTSSILPAIGALSDPAAVVNAVAQLAPSVPDLAAPLVTFQGSRLFQNLWLSRLDDVLCGQVRRPDENRPDEDTSTCRKDEPRSGWWVKGFGYFGEQGSRNGFAGYDSRIIGTMIAYDAPLDPDTRAGLGLGFARSTIDGKSFDAGTTGTDFNTYKATAYIGHERGPWFVYGDASFGWNDYSGTRHISFTGVDRTAEAEYSGQDYTGSLTTGYHFFAQGFTITPLASLQYTHLNLGGYTETGAGDVNLKVKSQSYDFLESGLGVKVAHAFGYRDGTYVPEVHFKWLRELYNPTLKNTAAFTAAGSPAFTIPGLKTSDDTFNVGAGLTLLSCACTARTWALEAVYDYDWRSDRYSAHRGMLKLSARF
jgi:uncharacterized protein with beta-barrel porin domain